MVMDMEATYFDSPTKWRTWLTDHGEHQTEIWIGFYKKGNHKQGMTYEEALEEALCFGWIDGLTKRVDEMSCKIRFTPRKSQSNWSARNISRVEVLIESGRMTPAGLIHIKAAQLRER